MIGPIGDRPPDYGYRGRHDVPSRLIDRPPAAAWRKPRAKPNAEVNTRRIMLIDRLVWRGGWPEVEGGGPSSGPKPRPVVR